MRVISRLLQVLLIVLPLTACDSPVRVTRNFCTAHTQRNFNDAYKLFSTRDRSEMSLEQYREFDWDRRSFDLRILQGHDLCSSSPILVEEREALVELELTQYASELNFSCVVPLIREDGSWRVTRHWAPMRTYRRRLDSARKNLELKFEDLHKEEDFEAYRQASAEAFATYFDTIDKAREGLLTAGGGAIPAFCEPTLNADGGQELIYEYMVFQKKGKGKPADLVRATERVENMIAFLREGYKPITTARFQNLRIDLIHGEFGKVETGGGRISEMVHNRLVFWGRFSSPLEWKINIYEKGDMVQEGFGAEVELLRQLERFVPNAPPVTIGIIDFPRLPSYTEELKVIFTEPDLMTSYTLDYPVHDAILQDPQ